MQLLHTIKEFRAWRKDRDYIAFVPTMGNLHEGHLQLIREAKKYSDHVVVSIFVNPIQFGAGEDFDSYPRTLDADASKLFEEGVSAVFAPDIKEMYPEPQRFFVEPPAELENMLCGASRKGHFKGVTTVVSKLFNIIQPNVACFGQKDYQQLFIIKDMVSNLNLPIQIVAVKTGRSKEGLALSSRNGYLTDTEKSQAPQLYAMLTALKKAIVAGNHNYLELTTQAKQQLDTKGWDVDYVEIRSAETLQPATAEDKALVILTAAKLGNTRLIDNIEVTLS